MLNKAVLMGRLTRDPELRYTQAGVAVASFSLAVDRDYQRNGEEREADFFDVTAWRHTGEFVSKYFSKGDMMVVEGRLELQKYTDRDGNNRQKVQIIANNVYFGSSKKSGGTSGGMSEGQSHDSPDYESYYSEGAATYEELSDDDGDLPF